MTQSILAGRDVFFDAEGNGLLTEMRKKMPDGSYKITPPVSKFWCIGFIDLRTDEEFYYGPPVPKDAMHPITGEPLWTETLGNPAGTLEEGIKALSEARMGVAHNGIGYDFLATEKLYPRFTRPPRAWDSLVMAKLVWPVDILVEPDLKLVRAGKMPAQLMKRHSLEAWGYRLNENKEKYTGGFDEWNPWMASYMMQDNRPGAKLWKLIEKKCGWINGDPYDPEDLSLEDPKVDCVWPLDVFITEHAVAHLLALQERDGILFDRDAAEKLAADLSNEKARLEALLVETFGSWWQAGKVVTPKADRNVKLVGYRDVVKKRIGKSGRALADYVGPPSCQFTPDAPYTPVERVTYSPSSRDHLGQRLQAVFGWKPKKFGANGKPTVDETVLEEIPEAVMPVATRKLILDYFVVNKTLGMLAQGSKAWLKKVDENNRMHGRCDPGGTITGRGSHSDPNLGQCPAVIKEKVKKDDGTSFEQILYGLAGRYGWECRELFIADRGWEQTGVDASSLELIDLGHYLVPYDAGAFRDRVCDPSRDPHTEHAQLTDLTRGETKTTTYLYIYGGSAYKLSLALTVEPHEVPALLAYRGLPMLLKGLARRFDEEFVAKLDDNQMARIAKARIIIVKFEKGIEGLKDLKDTVSQVAKRGWLRGMDGRKVHVRKAHAALNTLLQSAGAQTCKLWMRLTHEKLAQRGLVWGKDFRQTLWVHDELQFTHRPGLAPIIKECAYEAIKEAGIRLGLRGEYRGDCKTGFNWAECH